MNFKMKFHFKISKESYADQNNIISNNFYNVIAKGNVLHDLPDTAKAMNSFI